MSRHFHSITSTRTKLLYELNTLWKRNAELEAAKRKLAIFFFSYNPVLVYLNIAALAKLFIIETYHKHPVVRRVRILVKSVCLYRKET